MVYEVLLVCHGHTDPSLPNPCLICMCCYTVYVALLKSVMCDVITSKQTWFCSTRANEAKNLGETYRTSRCLLVSFRSIIYHSGRLKRSWYSNYILHKQSGHNLFCNGSIEFFRMVFYLYIGYAGPSLARRGSLSNGKSLSVSNYRIL